MKISLKILKFRTPVSIHSRLTISTRNWRNLLILPSTDFRNFIYMGCKLWNIAVKVLSLAYIEDIKIGLFKRKLKECLLQIQNYHNITEWCPQNFELNTATHHVKIT